MMISVLGRTGLIVFLFCLAYSVVLCEEGGGKLIKAGDYTAVPEPAAMQDESSSLMRVKRDASKHFESSTYECGSRRSCYVSLKTCDIDPRTCNYVLSWDYDSENVNFELSALTHAWISVVLSDDQYYGDDNIIVCSRHPDTGALSIDHYYKRRDDADLIHLKPDDSLVKKSIDYNQDDGYITCKFSRAKTVDNRYVTDLAKPHFIHIERGAAGELVFDKLRSFQPSETRVEFASNVHVPASPRSWLVKVHAVLAIIAWILLGSLGILIARYYKPMWPSRLLNTYRVWFTLHRSIMIFVLILTIVSFIFALIELDWKWSVSGHDYLHAILGLIVIVCTCLNPILGMCRPKPDSKRRCLFFWFHWFIGCVAYCLAVPTIFIGMDLSKSDIPNWCAWLLFAWVIFHIIVEIILEIHYCCTYSQSKHNYHESNIEYDELAQKNNTNKTVVTVKKRSPPGYRWKPSLLFFYALVTTIVVGILIVAIVLIDA